MENERVFRSSYILRVFKDDYNPFTPNVVKVNSHFIEYRKRNWHLFSVDSETMHFQNVLGLQIDKHFFGATVNIITAGDKIKVVGFSKSNAEALKHECSKYIKVNTQRGTTDALSDAIVSAVKNSNSGNSGKASVADEIKKLKELYDQGILDEAEYNKQKRKLLNS